ncbi:ECF transporter S component [Enterococcus sp. LJL98]
MSNKVQKMVSVSMFAAMGLVMQFVSFPILPVFPFLKVDFSDIPVLLSMFLYGPLAGVLTAFIRSTLHTLLTGLSPQNLVGDIASFIATSIFTLPIYYIFRRGTGSLNKILGMVTGILSMSLVLSIANYFIITPLYLFFFGVTADQFLGMSLASYVVVGIFPFNLIKGMMVSVVFLVLHAKLLPWLAKKQHFSRHHSF